MSLSNKTDAGKLEIEVYNYIKPHLVGICDFIKVGSRNTSINEDKMVYCNAPLSIYDLNAIGRTKMRIEIFVKDINGYKDAIALSKIRDAIVPNIDNVTDTGGGYNISYSDEMSGSDNAGYHFIFINVNVIIT